MSDGPSVMGVVSGIWAAERRVLRTRCIPHLRGVEGKPYGRTGTCPRGLGCDGKHADLASSLPMCHV